jgi:hypothetical protein
MQGIFSAAGFGVTAKKQERLKVFFERLMQAKPSGDHESAANLFEATLNAVEDEMSGTPYDLAKSPQDGRMYPPQPDNVRLFRNGNGDAIGTRRFSTAHNTFIANNGAIKIVFRADGTTRLDKPGRDGRRVDDQ